MLCIICGGDRGFVDSLETQDIEPMMGQCWPAVYDGGPTLTHHWFNVSC